MRRFLHVTAVVLLLVGRPLVAANDLELSFGGGRVTVIASDVPVGMILEEWSRVGNTQFVDADKLTSQRVRLQLVDVPEADALRVLLRDAAGYVAAPRAYDAEGDSRFDRVFVMVIRQQMSLSNCTPSIGSCGSARAPSQRAPTVSVPGLGPAVTLNDLGSAEPEDLREIVPLPFNLIDRSDQFNQRQTKGGTDTATAPRPGVVVMPTDNLPAVFIRPSVRPQTSDYFRR